MKPSEVLEQFNHSLQTADPPPFIMALRGNLNEYCCDFLGPREVVRGATAFQRALDDMESLEMTGPEYYALEFRNGMEDERSGTWLCELKSGSDVRLVTISIIISNEGTCGSFMAISCPIS